MTISSTVRKAGPYTGNGSTTQFSFEFKVFYASDVRVVKTDLASVESDLSLTTDYTVSLNADQANNPGGTVTLLSAPATGYKITITSSIQALQPVALTNNGGFYPSVINNALDRLTILVQQLYEQIGRSVKVGISSATTPDQLIGQLYIAVANALGYSTAASNSATAAAGSATAAASSATSAANSATSAGNTPVAVPTHAATSKGTPVDTDELPLVDSASSWALAKLTWANLKSGIWTALGGLIGTGTSKATPLDADYLPMMDSAASNATKSLSWANIKATLKTYFDTLYQTKITIGTALATTSGTLKDFAIPSGVKRVVLLFKDFSTSGTNHILVQLGSGGIQSTGYSAAGSGHIAGTGPSIASSTAGFLIYNDNAGDTRNGRLVIELMGSNSYVSSHNLSTNNSRLLNWWGAGSVALAGVLDTVRLTTVGGTDTFDNGSVNVMYE